MSKAPQNARVARHHLGKAGKLLKEEEEESASPKESCGCKARVVLSAEALKEHDCGGAEGGQKSEHCERSLAPTLVDGGGLRLRGPGHALLGRVP